MTKKNWKEWTFKEFWEEEKKKGKDIETVESEKKRIMENLRRQGFSDQQINEMKNQKVLDLMWKTLEKRLKALEENTPKLLETSITIADSLTTLSGTEEGRKALQTDKGLRRDLFEFANEMESTLEELLRLEDTLRQGEEMLKKKLTEQEKQKKE
jgi:hypothetical protein